MQSKYLLLFVILQLFTVELDAQNTPNLSQTSNPNGFTNMVTPQDVSVASGMLNSVTTLVPILPTTDASTITSYSPATVAKQQVVYLDGFQRPFQSVTKNVSTISGINKNLVQIFDNRLQRDQYTFLPFTSNESGLNTNAFQDQRTYYNNLYPNEGYSSFSKSVNTSNTTERSISNYPAGRSGVGLEYGSRTRSVTNPSSQIIIWKLDGNGIPVNQGYYNAGVLTGVEVTDPDAVGSNQSISSPRTRIYKDNDGKTILKLIADSSYSALIGSTLTSGITYSYTYYVYDAKGNLRVTMTPKAYKYYQSQGNISTAILNNLCYQYTYDSKERLCASKKPGEGDFTYTVYDRKDRPIMRQTPNERSLKEWEVSFFDALGRTKVTSIYSDQQTIPLDRNGWQNTIDNWSGTGIYSDLLNYLISPSMESQYPVGDIPVSDPTNNAYGSSYIANNKIMIINYYDNYQKLDPNKTLFVECRDTLNLPLQSINSQESPVAGRSYGTMTGSIVRILRSPNALSSTKVGDWRTTVTFGDDKGRIIANKSFVTDNVTSGHPVISSDYSGNQFDFSDNVLVSGHIFNNVNSRDNALTKHHSEYTKNQYDDVTRKIVKSVHQVDGSAWKTLNSFVFDDMGRTSRHTLGEGGEVQDLNYNIYGKLMGINGVYAETANKGGVSKTFGESLKFDYGFTKSRYDGKFVGVIWRGSSALDMYAYGYDYTQNGALKTAEFNHTENGVWKHTTMDYSVSNLFYDKNGNMIHMKQRGTYPPAMNGTAPFDMDDLSYSYESGDISNRLSQVTENATVGDYGAGDFRGTSNNTYDANGNLVTTTGNKNISGITYTRFNKPQVISFTNSSSIEYSYDALGNKVEELIIDKPNLKRKRTDYIGNAIYQNRYATTNPLPDGDNTDSLQYILTSEGRTDFNYSTLQPGEEFFVKDHLGNVRSTINVSSYEIINYLATYEIASAHLEDMVFDNVEDIRDIRPGGDGDNTMAANLNGSDPNRIIGSSLLLHVMAGDKVGMNVSTLFNDYDASGDAPLDGGTVLNSIVTTLTGGVGGFNGSETHDIKLVQSTFTSENYNALSDLIRSNTDDSKPKAYLNYALFDERMQLVREMSGAFQATGNGDWSLIGTSAPIEVPENGYLAIYLSNTSKNDVWFDQLAITFNHGNLLQENHYYPHGLPIFGLGSTTTDVHYKNNREKYQSNDYITDQGLNWMSFGARQYDPQIGRFLGVDKLGEFGGQDVYSPYVAMGNQPESAVDPNGMMVNFGEPSSNPNPQQANFDGGQSAGGFGSMSWFGFSNGSNPVDGTVNELMSNAMITFNFRSQLYSMIDKMSGENAERQSRVGGMQAADKRNNSNKQSDYQFDKGTTDAYGFRRVVLPNLTYEYQFTQNNYNSDGLFGVKLILYANAPGYRNTDFIQGKWSNSPANIAEGTKNVFLWDGDKKDPHYPYYWSITNRNNNKTTFAKANGFTDYFEDSPGRSTGPYGYIWNAQLTLVGWKDGQLQTIATFQWGYTYSPSKGTTQSYGPIVTTPNQYQQNLINKAKQ